MMKSSDSYLGIFVVAFSVVLWIYILPNWVVVPGGIKNFYQAPDFWIRVIATGLFFTGILLVIGAKRPRSQKPSPPGETRAKLTKLGSGIAVFFLFYMVLEYLGMVVSSGLALILLATIYGERRLKYVLPLAVLLPTGLYFFFLKIASIPMPVGILAGFGPF